MSSSEEGHIPQPAPGNRPRGARRPRGEGTLITQVAKAYTRIVDSNVCFPTIIDYGAEMWEQMDNGIPEPTDDTSIWTANRFTALQKTYNNLREDGSGLKTFRATLQDTDSGLAFRKLLCSGLISGRSQARSDDLTVIRTMVAKHETTKLCKTLGWSDATCANLLRTKHLDMDDDEIRQQLRNHETEAPHDEWFAALYVDFQFPSTVADPFEGFMRSGIFIAALCTIFTGAGSAFGGSGSGARGKGQKSKMRSLGPASLAYTAMLLRFVLASRGAWYTIKPGAVDRRFNYDDFYLHVVDFLERPAFQDDLSKLLGILNRAVFPNAFNHPRRIFVPGGSSMANVAAEAEAARAQQRAAARAAAEAEATNGSSRDAD
ncbi:hypothetical protein BDV93DRAFT_611902 [Ceratobasidium sp. AG-I]|nr:hypothetical protein BDV93DRAFT_611902 [Ceratobasidium sp. AG-I]